MDLILWRHAEAEDGTPDLERRLTQKGKRQAHLMAEWLGSHLPENLRILVSPAVRTRQTADALGMAYTISDDIAPDVDPTKLLAVAGWPVAGGSVLVVGHQPTLGLVAARLISAKQGVSIKKGAIFWVTRQEGEENVLQAVLSPEMLKSV